jgi:hypothetical protein
MIGRNGERRAHSMNPALRNADAIPVQTKTSGIFPARISCGYPSRTRAPRRAACAATASSSAVLNPRRRNGRATKKQETDQTSRSSTGARTRERASVGKVARGPNEHQPAGSPSWYAITPGAGPRPTSRRSAPRFPAPLPARQIFGGRRHTMHQQPPQAPRSPNRRSRSRQQAAVSGSKVNGPDAGRRVRGRVARMGARIIPRTRSSSCGAAAPCLAAAPFAIPSGRRED